LRCRIQLLEKGALAEEPALVYCLG